MTEKQKLRKELLKIRESLPQKRADYEKLCENPHFKNASVVFCYVSFGSEINTLPLIEHILKEKTLCVPYCTDKDGNMICVKINSLSDLSRGTFGILEPKNIAPFDKSLIDVCLVPGIAFDKSGARIGYGKGYYDRFLNGINAYKIGLCHRELLLDEILSDPHDVKINETLTF